MKMMNRKEYEGLEYGTIILFKSVRGIVTNTDNDFITMEPLESNTVDPWFVKVTSNYKNFELIKFEIGNRVRHIEKGHTGTIISEEDFIAAGNSIFMKPDKDTIFIRYDEPRDGHRHWCYRALPITSVFELITKNCKHEYITLFNSCKCSKCGASKY
jgi:hypothetical protein